MVNQITNIDKYNADMKKSLSDKLFFIDKVSNVEGIVDFGCADGSLLEALNNFQIRIGIDNNPKMKELAANKGFTVLDNLEQLDDCNNYLLNMSSVIHEVYSYLNTEEIETFWKNVFTKGFKYISIRDMMVSDNVFREEDDLALELFMPNRSLHNINSIDFADYWNYYTEGTQWHLLHYLLKYRYLDNWKREMVENYLPLTVEQLKKIIPDNYEIIFEDEYILPYLKDQVQKDFGYDIYDNTHIKLLLRKKD